MHGEKWILSDQRMKTNAIGLLLLVLAAWLLPGCTIQQRTLTKGLYLERASAWDPSEHRGIGESFYDDVDYGDHTDESIELVETEFIPAFAHMENPARRMDLLRETELESKTELKASFDAPYLANYSVMDQEMSSTNSSLPKQSGVKTNQIAASEGIDMDRTTSMTLIFIGAALLMLAYSGFSLLGSALVFLASIVVTPSVYNFIWGERMAWDRSRLGRIALSLFLSGLVLSGALGNLTELLCWVF